MALTTDIVAYYKMDGDATDSVGSNNGSVTGATLTTGKINQGYSLSGSSQYITISTGSEFDDLDTAMTIIAWIKLTATDNECIIGKYDATDNHRFILHRISGGKLSTILGHGTATDVSITGGTTLSTGVWYHTALTYDGTDAKLYINGSSDATPVTASGALSFNGETTYIGRYDDSSGSGYFSGVIDEVGIWNRALSSNEITALYNSGDGLQYPFSSDETANNALFFGNNF